MQYSKNRHFWRYLLSYLSLTLLPIIVVILFYISSFAKTFQKEILLNVEKDSHLVISQIDNEIHSLKRITSQAMISAPVLAQSNRFDPNTANDLKSFLSVYTSTNPFLQEIYVTLESSGYVISSTTTSTLSRLTEKYYLSDTKTPAEMAELFTHKAAHIESAGALRAPFSVAREMILFIYPLSPYLSQAPETIVFEVAYDTINKLICENLEMYQAQVWIVNQDGQKIGNFGILHEDVTQAYQNLSFIEKFSQTDVLGKNYIINQVSSAEGLQYIIFVPRTQAVFDKLYRMNIIFFFSILLVIIISGVAVVHLLRTQYFPLRRLHERVEHLVSHNKSSTIVQELDFALTELKNLNTSLSTSFEKSIDLIKNERLHMLLMGRYSSLEDFNMDCQEVNIHFGAEYLFISITAVQSCLLPVDEIGQLFKLKLQDLCKSYYLYSFELKKIILIHNISSPGCYKDVLQKISSISNEFITEKKGILTTGVGSCIYNIEDIPRSYYEATMALEHSFVKGSGIVISFEGINQSDITTPYPEQQFEKLKNIIASGNESIICECIDETVQVILNGNFSLSMIKGMCFTLVSITTNLSKNISACYVDKFPCIQIEHISSLNELAQEIKDWRQKYIAISSDFKDETSHLPIQEIISYLDAHCLNTDFSINQTAEHFGVSLSKFSQYFKEQTGQNVLDYTIQFRINEAKKLLCTTNDSLNDIALKTGYYNTSSFIRRFKQMNGITPGEYRKKHQTS